MLCDDTSTMINMYFERYITVGASVNVDINVYININVNSYLHIEFSKVQMHEYITLCYIEST